MEFLVILFGALFVYYLGIVVYHLISKVVYVKEAYVRSFSETCCLGALWPQSEFWPAFLPLTLIILLRQWESGFYWFFRSGF